MFSGSLVRKWSQNFLAGENLSPDLEEELIFSLLIYHFLSSLDRLNNYVRSIQKETKF